MPSLYFHKSNGTMHMFPDVGEYTSSGFPVTLYPDIATIAYVLQNISFLLNFFYYDTLSVYFITIFQYFKPKLFKNNSGSLPQTIAHS